MPAFADKPLDREAIYWEHEGNRAVRVGDWKLVAKGPGGRGSCTTSRRDRTELHDLAAKQPETREGAGRQVGGVGEAGERAAVDLEAGVSTGEPRAEARG